MAIEDRTRTGTNLQRLSDLSGYSVGPNDPDVRGWNVVGSGGETIGRVDDLLVDTDRMKVAALDIDVAGGDRVHVPVERVDVDRTRNQVRVTGPMTGTAGAYGTARGAAAEGRSDRHDRDRNVMTRSEEEVHVGTRDVQAGEVVVGKHVEHERVDKPVTLRHEEAYVERRPVSGERSGEIEMHDDEIRVPLTREEAVIEKRPVVKEEIVIGKKIETEQTHVQADVRREELDVNERGGSREPRKRRS